MRVTRVGTLNVYLISGSMNGTTEGLHLNDSEGGWMTCACMKTSPLWSGEDLFLVLGRLFLGDSFKVYAVGGAIASFKAANCLPIIGGNSSIRHCAWPRLDERKRFADITFLQVSVQGHLQAGCPTARSRDTGRVQAMRSAP